MQVRPDGQAPVRRLTVVQLLVGGTVVLATLALMALFMERGAPEYAPQPLFRAATHAPLPLIDVVVMGEASIAVTNLEGWNHEQVRTYLSALKKARAKGALSSVGIPAPSPQTGYEHGVVYLIDGHPTPDLLGQFVRHEPPGYPQIAAVVRGTYRWPPDRLTIGTLDAPLPD